MGYHIIENGKKAGWTAEKFDAGEGITFVPDDKPYEPSIDDVRAEKITQIKRWASEQINATAWRLERAKEKDALGVSCCEKPVQVLVDREAIRRASNRAEKEIRELKKIEEIRAYKPAVLASDKPEHYPLTHLQFLRRFSDKERLSITQARESEVRIADYFKLLELAKYINVEDPMVIEGVHMLEKIGLLEKGRAKQILWRDKT